MTRDLSSEYDVSRSYHELEHALLGRHRQEVARNPGELREMAKRRDAAQHRIEFRQFVELELADDIERERARQHDLDLVGQRLRVGRAAVLVDRLVGLGPQEHVLAPVIDDAGFRLVARREDIHRDAGRDGDQQGRQMIQRLRRISAAPSARRSRSPSGPTPPCPTPPCPTPCGTDAPTDFAIALLHAGHQMARLDIIMVAGRLIRAAPLSSAPKEAAAAR